MHLFNISYVVCTDSNINTAGSSANRKKQKKIWSSDAKQPVSITHTYTDITLFICKTKKHFNRIYCLSKESKGSLLLKEVGPEGRGQISAVQQLLDEVKLKNQSQLQKLLKQLKVDLLCFSVIIFFSV